VKRSVPYRRGQADNCGVGGLPGLLSMFRQLYCTVWNRQSDRVSNGVLAFRYMEEIIGVGCGVFQITEVEWRLRVGWVWIYICSKYRNLERRVKVQSIEMQVITYQVNLVVLFHCIDTPTAGSDSGSRV
jgi:hypothetical protein